MDDDDDAGEDDPLRGARHIKRSLTEDKSPGSIDPLSVLRNVPGQELRDAFERANAHMKPLEDAKKRMQEMMRPFETIPERMRTLGLNAGAGTAISDVSKKLIDQHNAIEALRPQLGIDRATSKRIDPAIAPVRMPDPGSLKHPLHETNERLERIEDRFEKMQDIAADGAAIATALQAASVEFLDEFKKAASSNDRAVSRGVLIGVIAIFIAVIAPAAQIVYSELRREPAITESLAPALSATLQELEAMRDSQAAASQRLTELIASTDSESVTVLRDIRELLLEQRQQSTGEDVDLPIQ